MKFETTGVVLGVISGKGGVGKSSLTGGLGIQFARQGKKVLIINLDTLDNVSSYLGLGNKHVKTIEDYYEVHTDPERIKDKTRIHSLSTLWIEDIENSNVKLHVLTVKDKNSFDIRRLTKQLMYDVITASKEEFDYILIDAPAGIDHGFILTVMLSNSIIGVTIDDIKARGNLSTAFTIVNKMISDETEYTIDGVEYNSRAKGKYLILNRVDPQTTTLKLDHLLQAIESNTSAIPLGYVVENKRIIGDNNDGITGNQLRRTADIHACYHRIVNRILDVTTPTEEKRKEMLSSWSTPPTKKEGMLSKMFNKIIH